MVFWKEEKVAEKVLEEEEIKRKKKTSDLIFLSLYNEDDIKYLNVCLCLQAEFC